MWLTGTTVDYAALQNSAASIPRDVDCAPGLLAKDLHPAVRTARLLLLLDVKGVLLKASIICNALPQAAARLAVDVYKCLHFCFPRGRISQRRRSGVPQFRLWCVLDLLLTCCKTPALLDGRAANLAVLSTGSHPVSHDQAIQWEVRLAHARHIYFADHIQPRHSHHMDPPWKDALHGVISTDPEVMHVTPCFTGTRVPMSRSQAVQFLAPA
jgi:hypothetical protein